MEFKHDPHGFTVIERLGISESELMKFADAVPAFLNELGLMHERDQAIMFIKNSLNGLDQCESALFFYLTLDYFKYLNAHGAVKYVKFEEPKEVAN